MPSSFSDDDVTWILQSLAAASAAEGGVRHQLVMGMAEVFGRHPVEGLSGHLEFQMPSESHYRFQPTMFNDPSKKTYMVSFSPDEWEHIASAVEKARAPGTQKLSLTREEGEAVGRLLVFAHRYRDNANPE